MKEVKVESFKVIGLSIRSTNENMQAAQDIGALWGRFMGEGIADKIPNKSAEDIYCLYTNYEGDATKPFDVILGCKVSTDKTVPPDMVAHTCHGGTYTQFISKGDLTQGKVIGETWMEIWKKDLDRNYSTDFEVYGKRAQNPKDAEVDIFIAINP